MGVTAIITGLQLGVQVVMLQYMWVMMDNLTDSAWLFEKARGFSFMFDKILIGLSSKVYYYYELMLNGTLITPELVTDIKGRLYVFVGIAILFRLAIVLIKYIVSPETFNDTKAGAGNLVKRIVLGCVIIAVIPAAFSFANRIQSAVLNDRIIEKTILPPEAYADLKSQNLGNRISMLVFQGLFTWNPSASKTLYQSVYNQYEKIQHYNTTDISSFDEDYITKKGFNDEYLIDYIPVLSTLAVGYILYTFIKFALELAFRQLKLAFLEIIAPFIIVDYMLKPGDDDTLKKWLNSTVSTYLIIFLRVLTVWIIGLLAYYLRNGIPDELGGATSLLSSADPLVKCLIILAAFAFLKEIPKMFSELTGYNLQENETINGLMQKGVSVVKGFAMAKVGSSIAKQQLAVTGGAQAVTSTAGGIATGVSTSKQGGSKGASWTAGLSAGGAGMGSMMGGISSAMHSASPIQGLGSAMGTSAYHGMPDTGKQGVQTKEQAAEAKQARGEKRAKNDTVTNVMNMSKNGNNESFYNENENRFNIGQSINVSNLQDKNIQGDANGNVTFQSYVAQQMTQNLASHKANNYNGQNIEITESDVNNAIDIVNSNREDTKKITTTGPNAEITRDDFKAILDAVMTAKTGVMEAKKTTSKPVGPSSKV